MSICAICVCSCANSCLNLLQERWKCDVTADQKLKTYTDPKSFKSLDDLHEKLQKLIDANTNESRKRKLDENVQPRKPKAYYITETCLYRCLQRSLSEESFYSKTALSFLMKHQFITTVVHDLVVDCIIKYKNISLLKPGILKFKLNESLVLKLLKSIINKMNPEITETIQKNIMLDGDLVDDSVVKEIGYILSLEVDMSLIREQLKLLLANEAVVLIQLLRTFLFKVSPAFPGKFELDKKEYKKVTEKKVIVSSLNLFCHECSQKHRSR